MNTNFERLIRLDSIRISKIIELIYYMLIGFMITIIISNILEMDQIPVFNKYDYESVSLYSLLSDIIMDLVIVVLMIYYIRKIAISVPFLFGLADYKPNLKNEAFIGAEFGVFFIIFTSLETLQKKLSALNNKIHNRTGGATEL